MRLLMVSGDRQVTVGERGPFHSMQREFSRYFERIDVICPRPPRGGDGATVIHDNVHFHPRHAVGRLGMVRLHGRPARGRAHSRSTATRLITSHDYGWFYNGLGSDSDLARHRGALPLGDPPRPGRPSWPRRCSERIDRWAHGSTCAGRAGGRLAFRVVNGDGDARPARRAGACRGPKILVLPSLYIDLEVFRTRAAPEHANGEHTAPPHAGAARRVGRRVRRSHGAATRGSERIIDALAHPGSLGSACPLRRLCSWARGRSYDRPPGSAREKRLGGLARFVEWVEYPRGTGETIYRAAAACVSARRRARGAALHGRGHGLRDPRGVHARGRDGRAARRTGARGGWRASTPTRSPPRSGACSPTRSCDRKWAVDAAELARQPSSTPAPSGVYANGLRRLAGEEEVQP